MLGFCPWQRWNHSLAAAPRSVQWCHGAAGRGRGAHREGTRQARGDEEEREPSWELLPLFGDTVVAGNDPQQHLRPGQANLRLSVPQKWYLWGTLNPKLFYAGKGGNVCSICRGLRSTPCLPRSVPAPASFRMCLGSWLDLSQAGTSLSELLGSEGRTSCCSSASGTGALSTSLCTEKPSQEKGGRLLPAKGF